MATWKITDVEEKPCTIILFCFYQSCNIKMDFLGTGSEYQNRTELAQNLVLSLALVIGMFCHHNVGLYETEGSRCDKY